MIVSLVFVVVVTILAVYFSTFNQAIITVNLFGYLVEGPTGLFLILALGIGALIGVLIMLPSVISRSWTLMQHKRRVRELEKAVSSQKPVEPIEGEDS
ncbi:MAG: LapA family protein [Chloroflexi bacterium]|nr:LapA family protein [Chloroflexota bacterium]